MNISRELAAALRRKEWHERIWSSIERIGGSRQSELGVAASAKVRLDIRLAKEKK